MKPFYFRRLRLTVGALGCALALASCTPLNTDNTTSPDKNVVDGNATIPNADNAVAASNDGNAASPVEFSALETIYVPGKDDLLHAQKVSRMAIDSQLKSGDPAAPGLQELIEKAPAFFPKGAKINSTTLADKGLTIDLNQSFANDEFWRTKGEKVTELAVYALVNSAANTGNAQGTGAPKPVMFTVEKKPVKMMGEFDVEGAIEPQMRLVAPQ